MSAPTVIVATDYPPPPVRVRRAPQLEPPFDDEDDPGWPPLRLGGHVAASGVNVLAQPGRGPRTQRPVTPRAVRGPTDPDWAAATSTAPSGTAQPGTAQPGIGQPGIAQPGTATIGVAAPGIAAPRTAQPGIAQPRTAQPGIAQPRTAQPGIAHPGIAQPGIGARSGAAQVARNGPGAHAGLPHGPARRQPSPGAVAAQRFVGVCIEILNGHRAVSHLRAVTMPGDLKQITDQLVSRTNRTYLGRPGRTVTAPQRVRLVGMRTCEPRDGVVEAAAVLGYGIHTWAMAVRMERPTDVWLCKLIQVV